MTVIGPRTPARTRPALLSLLALSIVVLVLCSETGFGATSASRDVTANVLGTLTLTDPVAKNADPPVCTKAVVAVDTDACDDVTYAPGDPDVLSLGALSGADVQAASLTWKVTTTSRTGYVIRIQNAGAAPFLRADENSIADIPADRRVAGKDLVGATQFGIAVGNAAADDEGAVTSAWLGEGGAQGELFATLPTQPVDIGTRATPQTDDPVSVTFAAAAASGTAPAQGAYSGVVRVSASIL